MAPEPVESEVPNVARMYDYHLGGSHNFAVDREAAERTKLTMPWVAEALRANRAFLRRAVLYCQSAGISQFLDLGSGIPSVGNVHEVAREKDPAARVAYVDNEPVAVAVGRELLAGDPRATVLEADLRDVDAVLGDPAVTGLIDFSRPVALLTVAVVHFFPDTDGPVGLLERYRARLAPGSAHVLSHATADRDPEVADEARSTYRVTNNPVVTRCRAEVAALLGDWEPVPPGLVDATEWRPNGVARGHAGFYAAVAHAPGDQPGPSNPAISSAE